MLLRNLCPKASSFLHLQKQFFSYRPITKEDRKLPHVVSGAKLAKKLQKKLKSFLDTYESCFFRHNNALPFLEAVRRASQALHFS